MNSAVPRRKARGVNCRRGGGVGLFRGEYLVPGLLSGTAGKRILIFSAFLACSFAFLYFGWPLLTGPRLSADQKQWTEFHGDDPAGYPVEVLSHGYRMVQASRRESKHAEPRSPRMAAVVEWEWKAVMRNNSPRDEQVYVEYLLLDKDRLPVDADSRISPQPVAAWETVTVQHRTEMFYDDLRRVSRGIWEITRAGSKKKPNGF